MRTRTRTTTSKSKSESNSRDNVPVHVALFAQERAQTRTLARHSPTHSLVPRLVRSQLAQVNPGCIVPRLASFTWPERTTSPHLPARRLLRPCRRTPVPGHTALADKHAAFASIRTRPPHTPCLASGLGARLRRPCVPWRPLFASTLLCKGSSARRGDSRNEAAARTRPLPKMKGATIAVLASDSSGRSPQQGAITA